MCYSTTSPQVYMEPFDPACSPDCKISLRLVEDPRGYNITLRASRNRTTLEARSFHFGESLWIPESLYRKNIIQKMNIKIWIFLSPSSSLLVLPSYIQHNHYCPPYMETPQTAESVHLESVQRAHTISHKHLQHKLIGSRVPVHGEGSSAWHMFQGQCYSHYIS